MSMFLRTFYAIYHWFLLYFKVILKLISSLTHKSRPVTGQRQQVQKTVILRRRKPTKNLDRSVQRSFGSLRSLRMASMTA